MWASARGGAGRDRYPHAGPSREGRAVAEQREARNDVDTGGSAGAADRARAAVRVRAGHAGRLRGAGVQERPPTLGALFAENRSDLPFFVYDDERYSYEEAYAAACRIGRLLVDRYGIGKGDRVTISMRNYPEWVMCFMAVTSIGGSPWR